MAANDYYNSHPPDQIRRSDAPLPALPIPLSSYSSYRPDHAGQADSPITPIDYDANGPFHRHYSQQSMGGDSKYYGAGGGGRVSEQGTYADDIPLRSNLAKYSTDGGSPSKQPFAEENGLPYPTSEPQPGTNQKRKRKKKKFFRLNNTWVVYVLTIIQVTVFIVELVRNGRFHVVFMPANPKLTSLSYSYQDTNPDTSASQSNAWSIDLRVDQHGSSVRAMHEECGQSSKLARDLHLVVSEHHHV